VVRWYCSLELYLRSAVSRDCRQTPTVQTPTVQTRVDVDFDDDGEEHGDDIGWSMTDGRTRFGYDYGGPSPRTDRWTDTWTDRRRDRRIDRRIDRRTDR